MSTYLRWKRALEEAIAEYKNQTVFQLATLTKTIPGTSFDGPIPRVRSLVFRQFLVDDSHPTLPLLLSTTDVRTPKVTQVSNVSDLAELAWWIEGTKEQFRIAAKVYIFPHPKYTQLRARFFDEANKATPGHTGLSLWKPNHFDWEAKRMEVFKALSPAMKASWCRPHAPGTRLEGGQEEAKKWPVTIEEPSKEKMNEEEYENAQKLWNMALENFALVVMDPVQVDYVELGVVPNKRTVFTKKEGSAEWEEEEVVP